MSAHTPQPERGPDDMGPHDAAALPTLADMLAGSDAHLMDGAMGTMLYERGVFLNVCYDELNRTRPELIDEVHRAYLDAGSELIETNTFGANPVKLSAHGLADDTEAINRAGAEIAVRSARGRARVLGAVGPLGIRIEPWGPTSEAEARAFFARQIRGLVDGGVDGILLETFQDPVELRQALEAARGLTDLPVLAQVTLVEGGRTAYGTEVERVVADIETWGADAVGFNCSVGPAELLEAVERAVLVTKLPLLTQPNAGLPRTVGGRNMYLASPEYMARYARRIVAAGARFIGGCCGTTPEHIRFIAETLEGADRAATAAPREGGRPATAYRPARADTTANTAAVTLRPPPPATREHDSANRTPPSPSPSPPPETPSPFATALARRDFATTVELVPPRGWDPSGLLADTLRLTEAGVTTVSILDAPRGVARMAALPSAALIARETGIDVIAHYACRDRNMIGMISDLLGAAASGIRNLLLVTGDPAPVGVHPGGSSALDIDSIGLVNVVRRLNEGEDPGGHPVDPATRFLIGVALNQGAADAKREDRRFRFKVEAGADFAVSQPVFDAEALTGFLDRHPDHRIPVLAGIWPIASLRNAEFLANELPGVVVPERVLERMHDADARGEDAAREEGIRVAVENVEAVRSRVAGIQLSVPRGEIELALEVLRRTGITGVAP